MIKYDDYDEAMLGPAYTWRDQTQVEVLVYDAEKIRDILMKRDSNEKGWHVCGRSPRVH